MPNADVTVINTETNFTRAAKSDAAGEYSLTALPLGPYRVEARASRSTCRPASSWMYPGTHGGTRSSTSAP